MGVTNCELMENKRTIEERVFRSRTLALQDVEMTDDIHHNISNNKIVKLITRLYNFMAANFRATKRVKCTADFLNEYKIAEEETAETIHFSWIISE